jgi:hypothetical protein
MRAVVRSARTHLPLRPMRARALLLLLPLLALTACRDKASFSSDGFARDAATGASPHESDRYAIHSSGGELKLGLTDEVVYYRLSDKLLARIDGDIQPDSVPEDGIGGAIAGAVRSGVSKVLRHRMEYRVADLRELRFEDGQFTFVFEDGSTRRPNVSTRDGSGGVRLSDGNEVNPAFAPEDARRLIAAFQLVKQAAPQPR